MSDPIWVQLTAGRGPAACCWVVARLAEQLEVESAESGCVARLVEAEPGPEPGTLRSALLSVSGPPGAAEALTAGWRGTIQWIGPSPFRPDHKRKNWYVGVSALRPPVQPDWSPSDLRVEAYRGGGPGGQHANKNATAIRVTHVPTGLTATASGERSQQMNRKLALARLAERLAARGRGAAADAARELWTQHDALERGDPVRVYRGSSFKRSS